MKELIEQELLPILEKSVAIGKWKVYEEYKDSGVEWLGKIPEHWEVRRLKYASFINPETLQEYTNSDYMLQYIDISNVNEKGEIGEIQELTFENAPSRARRIVRNGDTILSTVRTYLRSIGYISEPSNNLVVSTGFAALRPYPILNSKFLFRYVQSNEFVNIIVSHSEGVSYPAISPSHLVCLKLLLPSLPEQQTITTFLDQETTKINDLIAKKERMIELLQERRTAIINRAITKGLNPNVTMKDSGVEWLGEIPEHWNHRQFKHIAEISYGLTLELDRTETEGTYIISLPNVTKDGQLILGDVPLTPLNPLEKNIFSLKKEIYFLTGAMEVWIMLAKQPVLM